jgi:hypothetical protein
MRHSRIFPLHGFGGIKRFNTDTVQDPILHREVVPHRAVLAIINLPPQGGAIAGPAVDRISAKSADRVRVLLPEHDSPAFRFVSAWRSDAG